MYIDGTDAESEGTFVSTKTGDQLPYTNWRSGEPNNYRNNEDCVTMYRSSGKWSDNPCSRALPAICERRKFWETN